MNDVSFLQAITANPEDDVTRLIYADWLDEHGQSERAEFIRFQCEHPLWDSSHPQFLELLARDSEFDSFKHRWEKELPSLPGVKWWSGWFKRGFIDTVTFLSGKAFREHAVAVFAASPLAMIEVKRLTNRTVEDVLACPLLPRLRSLHLLGTLTDAGVPLVAACPGLARLRSLFIWGGGFGDLAAEAIAASPNLTGLKGLSFSSHRIGDRGATVLVDSPNLSGLTDLVLHGTRGLSRTVIRKLKKRFPRLK